MGRHSHHRSPRPAITVQCRNCGAKIKIAPSLYDAGYGRYCKGGVCRREYKYTLSKQAERFWSKVQVGSPEECWPWAGGMSHGRSGKFEFAGKIMSVGCLAWQLANGGLPVGDGDKPKKVWRTCGNTLCCNPAHLIAGRPRSPERIRPGKAFGERIGNAKLTDAQVAEIRTSGTSTSVLAARCGVTRGVLWKARTGRTWKHLPMPEEKAA